MKTGINRLLAILLSCAMLLGMLPAFAEEVPVPAKAPAEEAGAETEATNAPTETEDLPLMQTCETIPFANALSDGLMMDEPEELYYGGNAVELDQGSLLFWLSPDDVSGTRVQWTSSNPSVVRIDTALTNVRSGYVRYTAVGVGTATITGTTMDGSGLDNYREIRQAAPE